MKKLYIIGVILVVLFGGVGYGVWTMRQAMVPETTGVVPAVVSSTSSDPVVSDHLTGQDSLKNLLALGKTLECSFRTSDDGITTETGQTFIHITRTGISICQCRIRMCFYIGGKEREIVLPL